MKVFGNGTYHDLDIKQSLILGKLVDPRVQILEREVSKHYHVEIPMLSAWQYDTEAKKVLCFLLVRYLQYSIGSVAKAYNINRLYLKNEITNLYKTCLLDANTMGLMDMFFNTISIYEKRARETKNVGV